MRFRLFTPSSVGLSAMLVAMCGYAAAQTAPQNIELVGVNANLVQNLDSKNAAQGQKISAELTSSVKNAGSTELPKGTILLGQVEKVQPSSNSGPAQLSIVFDQARLRNGQTIPVKATLLGAYPVDAGSYYEDGGADGSLEEVLPTHIASDQKIDQEPGTLSHVALHSAVQSSDSGVFTSKDRNIDLRKGTRLQIAIAAEPANGTAAASAGN